MSAEEYSQRAATRARSAPRPCLRAGTPRWTSTSRRPVPDPAEVEVPEALRAEIETIIARYPDRHSAALPALARRAGGARLVLAAGHRPGGRGDAGDPRLPVLGGDVLRHAAHAAHRAALRVRVHQRRLPPAQREGGLRRDRRGGARPGPRGRRGARVRVPGRLRHGADGLGRRALRRPARRLRRPRARGRRSARSGTILPGPRARGRRLPAAVGDGGAAASRTPTVSPDGRHRQGPRTSEEPEDQ